MERGIGNSSVDMSFGVYLDNTYMIEVGAKQRGISLYFDVFIFLSVIFFVFEGQRLLLMLMAPLKVVSCIE